MFTDEIKLKLSAGNGGNGVVSWRKEKYIPKGGPAGGNGGRGGSVILRANPEIYSLDHFRNHRLIFCENGHPGASGDKQGRSGKDLILEVPLGTVVRDTKTNDLLFDFTKANEKYTVCIGGRGGKGNTSFKTATNQAPNKCTPGRFGQEREVELELKLLADVGFLGFPNAGKSTLLSQIAAVDVKIGAYPFTTLKPNLSYIEFDDYSRIYIADIPGIIENAHQNRGLGLSFLRHVERSSTLVYVIDLAGTDGRNPLEDFLILRNEAENYSSEILKKPFIVALNKIDQEDAVEHMKYFQEHYPFDPSTLFPISAMNGEGISPFVIKLREVAQSLEKKYY